MISRLRFVAFVVIAFVMAGPVAPRAFAQEPSTPIASAASSITFPPLVLSAPVADAPSTIAIPVPFRTMRRPAALPMLYVAFAALQVADMQSTMRGLAAGGTEASPVVRGFAGNRGAMLALKGGVTVGTIYLSEKLWKKNRLASIVMMAAMNSAYAMIVANNYRFAGR